MSELIAKVIVDRIKGRIPTTVGEVRCIEIMVLQSSPQAWSKYVRFCDNNHIEPLSSDKEIFQHQQAWEGRYPKLVQIIKEYGL